MDPNGEGMTSVIAENKKYDFISIKHLGIIKNGKEDTESPDVKFWAPAFENYTFAHKDDIPEVKVDVDMNEEYEKMLAEIWLKTLSKLKQISEKKRSSHHAGY